MLDPRNESYVGGRGAASDDVYSPQHLPPALLAHLLAMAPALLVGQ